MYRYLFYRLFLLTRSWTREEEQPEWGAASGITCLIILNAITVAMAAELIAGLQLALADLPGFFGPPIPRRRLAADSWLRFSSRTPPV